MSLSASSPLAATTNDSAEGGFAGGGTLSSKDLSKELESSR